VIDLKTGKLEPGKQSDLLKGGCPFDYDAGAHCDQFRKFIHATIPDFNVVAYLRRLLGYSLTGLRTEHILPIFHGEGRNGKSTLFEILKSILGDLAHKTKAETLLDSGRNRGSGAADADTMAFFGKRLVWGCETNDGSRLNIGKVKEMSGGDTLSARAPFGKRVIEFTPTHTLFLLTNNLPYASSRDKALWARVHIIPFDVAFVDDPVGDNEKLADKKLLSKLLKELPGIAKWFVDGCLEWQKEGLDPPDRVKAATAAYRNENDDIVEFIADTCEFDISYKVKSSKLWGAYMTWCSKSSVPPISRKAFGQELGKHYKKTMPQRVPHYHGLNLETEIKARKENKED
jgi:putative DNA primase/helicase